MHSFRRKESQLRKILNIIGSERFIDVATEFARMSIVGKSGSYSRLLNLTATVEGELRVAADSEVEYVQNYVRQFRNNKNYKFWYDKLSEEIIREQYEKYDFADVLNEFFWPFYFDEQISVTEQQLIIRFRCDIVENLFALENAFFDAVSRASEGEFLWSLDNPLRSRHLKLAVIPQDVELICSISPQVAELKEKLILMFPENL